jgi:lysophospholipid acyltransferase (LPLAT)-like uncharacterized protein
MATFPQRPRASGVVVPQQVQWHGRLAARLIWLVVKACGATVRFKLDDPADFLNRSAATPEPVIFCIWHNRLALCLKIYQRFVQARQPARRLAAMVSASRDGGLLARALELFAVQPVRGSSSRRGPQALLELTTWAERGYDLAITPDGPRGPRYVVQDGVIALSQLTGRPIVPASYHLSWKWQAKSWDRFQIPLPFTC